MAEDDLLPCDVMVPPRTIIRKGCKLSTLLEAISHREGRSHRYTTFEDIPTAKAAHQSTIPTPAATETGRD